MATETQTTKQIFKSYLKPALVKAHGELKLADATSTGLDLLLGDLTSDLAYDAVKAAEEARRKTVMPKDIEAVVKNELKEFPEVAASILCAAADAVAKYASSDAKVKQSRSTRAGLVFPIPRVETVLRGALRGGLRLSEDASVYLTAALENIAVGILEDAGNIAKGGKKKIVVAKHVNMAVEASGAWRQLVDTIGDEPRHGPYTPEACDEPQPA
jgi:histone H2A